MFSPSEAIGLGELVQSAYAQYGGSADPLPNGWEQVSQIWCEEVELALPSTAYALPVHVPRFPKGLYHGLSHVISHRAARTQWVPFGFIARRDSVLAVALRGTQTPWEWLKDFEFSFADFAIGGVPCSAESGMLAVYRGLRTGPGPTFWTPADYIRNRPGDATKVLVGCHSLGGPVGMYLATEVPAKVVSFGAPAGFDLRGANAFDDKDWVEDDEEMYRIVNAPDVVPTQPPAFAGYHHCGTPINVRSDPSTPKTWAAWHDMSTYLKTLRAM